MFARYLRDMAALCCALLLAPPALAQEPIRIAAGEAYAHPHSGVVIPAQLGGNPRTLAVAYAADMLDVGLNFESDGGAQALSIYIYRNTNGAVPVWFAQAQSVVEGRDVYDDPVLAIGPEAFVPPGQPAASGLRAIYEPGRRSGMRSTGVALFAVGEWYVKLRASSATRTPDGLRHWMESALAEIALPAYTAEVVAPVEDCANRLRFRGRSRDARGDAADAVMGSIFSQMLGSIVQDRQAQSAPAIWCRDSVITMAQALYRANGSESSYLFALGDNGNAVRVGPELRLDGISPEREGDNPRHTVVLMTASQNLNFALQDRLPSPQRVIDLIESNRVNSSTRTWGEDRSVEINADALGN